MCRLLGVVSSETTAFRFSLHEAPRSLAALSPHHPHGWGLAVHGHGGWSMQKYAACAHEDARFHELAGRASGEIMIAHIRKRTVGPIKVENTHPFHQGRWVFAHNGTIDGIDWFASRTSKVRAQEVEGDTDSERFFAFLLTAIDEAGTERKNIDAALASAVSVARTRPDLGAANFLLSDGASLYAFRFGRTLHLLSRARGEPVRTLRESPETDASIETPWSARRNAYIVASEQLTDEPFQEIPDGALVRIDHGEVPMCTTLLGDFVRASQP